MLTFYLDLNLGFEKMAALFAIAVNTSHTVVALF